MKERDRSRAERLDATLLEHSSRIRPLPGIADATKREVLVLQLIDSLHRVEYPQRLRERLMSPRRTDPSDEEFFDPIRAAVFHRAAGDHDEACWLVFLFTVYGKSEKRGWRLVREVYGRLGQGGRWDWVTVSADPSEFTEWIRDNAQALQPRGAPRAFGNHRKFETVVATGRTVETYVPWIGPEGHRTKFATVLAETGGDPHETFDLLYRSMSVVFRFGRLARFDYLTMLGKLDLAPIEPGSTYMNGATGPVTGARLLFVGDPNGNAQPRQLEEQLKELDSDLGVGMQVLEDAVCNWQKSPTRFRRFRG